jgi:hypothetical protein
MYLSVINVKPLDGYKLLLKFENDEERIFDVSPYFNMGKFAELKDVSLFNTVTVKFDSMNGQIIWILIRKYCMKKVQK